ncbi:uncharacterized protein LOC111356020 [Spodoptera litura]|uniref:Uncharacterized protein LOC111356020 n=1 Tax=Spodoptera litura TaxID=69820 RepID=A0A9J7EDG7_SPOLT|nr:uncharacterized protein LOC111356020 [Spodoptera litura]
MDKLRFEFVIKAGEDPKSNIICITSITNSNGSTFSIPEQLQPAKLHDAVIKTQAFQKVRNTLQKRHDKRQIWISVTPEISDGYLDEDGNMQFKNYFLEETRQETCKQTSTTSISEEALTTILENFTGIMKDKSKPHNIRKLTEKFIIDKFTMKTSNATQWMNIFETECTRLGIEEDTMKIEALRLFLEDACLDWYSSMLIKYTVNSDWFTWKQNFCETYADKGWSPIRYAILFRYRQGSLLEYAVKKERLLLEVNKSIDSSILIDLIATGLPNFITDKIERDNLKDTKDLFNNIRSLEHLVNKKNIGDKKIKVFESKIRVKDSSVKPCRICEQENKGNRYHPESACWFKNKNAERPKQDQIRNVNNSELEIELNEMNPKNC